MKHKAMQRQIYRFIVQCVKEQGYPPSVREIGDAVGLKSPSTVHFHLKNLADEGYIEKGADVYKRQLIGCSGTRRAVRKALRAFLFTTLCSVTFLPARFPGNPEP